MAAAKSAKGRKVDRNRPWCKAYKLRGQREKNKVKRLVKHLARLPNDMCAVEAMKRAKVR